MIYIAVCDDNEKLAKALRNKICQYVKENYEPVDITVYTQSTLLQYDIEDGKYFDLVLSDIEMPNIDGMNLVAYIKKHLPEVLIIFITSHLKYAIDAFELSIFRYIPKNTLSSRLPLALRDAFNMIKMQSDKFYTIEMPSRVEKIPYNKILYIQREGKNSVITLLDNSTTKVRKSLSQVFKEPPVYNFINDRLVDESAVLRPLSWHLILYVFRYFSRKWQKISDCECPDYQSVFFRCIMFLSYRVTFLCNVLGQIHYTSESPVRYFFYEKVVKWCKELKSEDFIYVDRGDIVNLAHIMRIKDSVVELQNGVRLPASQAKLDSIKSRLSEFWGERI